MSTTSSPAVSRKPQRASRWLACSCAAVMVLAGSSVALGQGGKIKLSDLPGAITDAPPAPVKPAEPAAPDAKPADATGERRILPITSFEVRYAEASKGIARLPQMPEILAGAVAKLGRKADGTFVARKDGGDPIDVRLGDFLSASPINFDGGPVSDLNDGGAISAVTAALSAEFKKRGFIGVFATPIVGGLDANGNAIDGEVDESLADVRQPAGRTTFRLEVFVAPVGEVRSLAAGDRVDLAARVNSPLHAGVRSNSPVKVGEYIDRDAVDNYTLWLGRHPGRRVDVGVGPGSARGDLTLDYLVSESKPWQLIFQVSNTGTAQTDDWRERFGFQHTQLTGRDDILRVDYLTAGFDSAHALLASYEFPFLFERLRLRPYATFSRYTASDVGSAQDFTGESWLVGAEAIWNVYQSRDWFVDLVAGARYENIRTSNQTLASSGQSGFLVPSVGVRLDRGNEKWSTNAGISIEANLGELGNTKDSNDLLALGRFDTDKYFQIVRANFDQSFYLEPLLAGDSFAGKGLAPGQNWQPGMSLAHEMFFTAKLFTTLDQRLIPNYQDVQGGLFTVRGYPENFIAGDTTYSFTAEYRLHLERLFGIEPNASTVFGKPFRAKPQEPFGATDWGLIVRGFFDAARVEQSQRLPFENDDTLMSAGFGAEVQLWRNVNARLDVGFPLREVTSNNKTVKSGDSRLHFILTVVF